jgi:hypothetical protein
MSEQEVNRWIFKNGPEHSEYVKATDYDALQSRLDAAEREKSALRHALDVKEEFYQDALHSHIVLNAKVAKRDAVLRETADSLRCSKVFPALLESIDALLSSAEPVKAEFCCEHSYKVAKQAAWGARDLTHCKCDHNEYCEHCWPDDFKEGGKWYNGFEAQQSAHVSVPRELLADLVSQDHDTRVQAERRLYALLNGGEA